MRSVIHSASAAATLFDASYALIYNPTTKEAADFVLFPTAVGFELGTSGCRVRSVIHSATAAATLFDANYALIYTLTTKEAGNFFFSNFGAIRTQTHWVASQWRYPLGYCDATSFDRKLRLNIR